MKRQKNLEGGTLTALSICHDQVGAQNQQREAREKIKEEFIKRELNHVQYIEVEMKHTIGAVYNATGLIQPCMWLPISTMYCHQTDTIFLGYHEGDDFWARRHEAEKSFSGFCAVQDKTVSVVYPLEYKSKANIIMELKDRGLYDMCWYCENPNKVENKPCGECAPCKTHRTALWQIEEFNMVTTNECPQLSLGDDNIKPYTTDDVIESAADVIKGS